MQGMRIQLHLQTDQHGHRHDPGLVNNHYSKKDLQVLKVAVLIPLRLFLIVQYPIIRVMVAIAEV
jgi:hypothetical protein